MPPYRFAVLFTLFALGCSDDEPTRSADAGAASDAATDTAIDSETSDATPTDAAGETSTACVLKRAAKTAECAEDCDARLFLPGGDAYCTTTCTSASFCASFGSGLTCSSGTGTCMPTCTTDATCTAAGFKRCDPDAGACDTI